MRNQCIPGLPPVIEGLGTRLDGDKAKGSMMGMRLRGA